MQAVPGLRFTALAAGLVVIASVYCLAHGLVLDDEINLPRTLAWAVVSRLRDLQVERAFDIPTRHGTFAAALGVGLRIRALRPVAAIIGIAGFALWASNEAIQQTMTLLAFDKWRAACFAADEATRAIIRSNAAMYDGLWDAFYFLLLIGFSIGNFSLGVGLARAGRGVTRLVGFFLVAAVAITLPITKRHRCRHASASADPVHCLQDDGSIGGHELAAAVANPAAH